MDAEARAIGTTAIFQRDTDAPLENRVERIQSDESRKSLFPDLFYGREAPASSESIHRLTHFASGKHCRDGRLKASAERQREPVENHVSLCG